MHCPYCLHKETKVNDKRDGDGVTRRRRECLKCTRRFNTQERHEVIGIRVIKKNGQRENFDTEKLKRGVMRACEKRPIPSEKIDKMLAQIQEKLMRRGREVQSQFIGDLTAKELKKLDKVAYIRFASVYRDFTELDDFKKEIRELIRA